MCMFGESGTPCAPFWRLLRGGGLCLRNPLPRVVLLRGGEPRLAGCLLGGCAVVLERRLCLGVGQGRREQWCLRERRRVHRALGELLERDDGHHPLGDPLRRPALPCAGRLRPCCPRAPLRALATPFPAGVSRPVLAVRVASPHRPRRAHLVLLAAVARRRPPRARRCGERTRGFGTTLRHRVPAERPDVQRLAQLAPAPLTVCVQHQKELSPPHIPLVSGGILLPFLLSRPFPFFFVLHLLGTLWLAYALPVCFLPAHREGECPLGVLKPFRVLVGAGGLLWLWLGLFTICRALCEACVVRRRACGNRAAWRPLRRYPVARHRHRAPQVNFSASTRHLPCVASFPTPPAARAALPPLPPTRGGGGACGQTMKKNVYKFIDRRRPPRGRGRGE